VTRFVAGGNFDPVIWWRDEQKLNPSLVELVRKSLHVMAASKDNCLQGC
jgi:hypothetical protein